MSAKAYFNLYIFKWTIFSKKLQWTDFPYYTFKYYRLYYDHHFTIEDMTQGNVKVRDYDIRGVRIRKRYEAKIPEQINI